MAGNSLRDQKTLPAGPNWIGVLDDQETDALDDALHLYTA